MSRRKAPSFQRTREYLRKLRGSSHSPRPGKVSPLPTEDQVKDHVPLPEGGYGRMDPYTKQLNHVLGNLVPSIPPGEYKLTIFQDTITIEPLEYPIPEE